MCIVLAQAKKSEQTFYNYEIENLHFPFHKSVFRTAHLCPYMYKKFQIFFGTQNKSVFGIKNQNKKWLKPRFKIRIFTQNLRKSFIWCLLPSVQNFRDF